jgi:PAS domain S-box-containing protein
MLDQELDRYWKTVVNTIHDGIMIVNNQGAIVSVNRALEKITGYRYEELLGRSCDILQCDACTRALNRQDGFWCDLFREGTLNTCKCMIRHKDGRLVHAIKNASLLRDSDGQVIGAVGTLTDISELIEKEYQLEAFRRELQAKDGFHGIIGVSAAMRQVFELIENAAHSDAPVIIYGESGTGKELVSRAIHDIGDRRRGPFVRVNCASLTESLLESELFGHVRGAFTGAVRDRKGRFEAASGGDIFLDEIGDLPKATQVKLLRVLEEKVVERVGESSPLAVDVRIISATNRDLPRLVKEDRFRKDFFFRINVIPIHLPPLRERTDDIPLLAEAFFRKIRLKSGKDIEGIDNRTMEVLTGYGWPGNVRELKSAFEYAFVACHDSLILPRHLPHAIYGGKHPLPAARRRSFNLKEIEKQELVEALEKADGNQSRAAELLGVSRVTVYNRMKRYGVNAKRKIELGS